MIVRRIGLVLALVLALLAVFPALDIRPDPTTERIGELSVVVAVLTCAIALVVVVFFFPAWRGSRAAALTIATAQLAGILTAVPAFFAPADIVPPGGVLLAAVSTLVSVAVFAMIAFDVSSVVLNAVAVVVVIAAYASIVATATWVVPPASQRLVQTLAAVAVALAYQPLVGLLRRTMGRALYGGRIEPAETALRVTRAGIAAHGADPVEAAMDETASALRMPRIELIENDLVVATGVSDRKPGEQSVELPLVPDRGIVLRITLSPHERGLHREDRAALLLLAPALALLVRESALLAAVRAARAAVADAREREQLTLHRDLHDGLGPLLTGAVMRADAASNLLGAEPAGAREQLDAARSDLRVAVAELRRVVYGLWPLELEQRGLRDAIAARAVRAGLSADIPAQLSPLPPAVELAVFRIASEAIANVERHAPDASAHLRLTADGGEVLLEVTNAHVPSPASAGIGLDSMRARAEELGGVVEAGAIGDRWRVSARIPIPSP